MKINLQSSLSIATLAIGLCGILTNASAQAVDVAAAEAQLKDSKCTKCHAVSSKRWSIYERNCSEVQGQSRR